jgi:ABC-type methionine transport system ATPase subunit
MATPKSKSAAKAPAASPTAAAQSKRLWLMYPAKRIQEPVVWQLGQKFPVVTNVRQASVTDEIGIVCLELSGAPAAVKAAISWLEKTGIKVEPVEINVIES